MGKPDLRWASSVRLVWKHVYCCDSLVARRLTGDKRLQVLPFAVLLVRFRPLREARRLCLTTDGAMGGGACSNEPVDEVRRQDGEAGILPVCSTVHPVLRLCIRRSISLLSLGESGRWSVPSEAVSPPVPTRTAASAARCYHRSTFTPVLGALSSSHVDLCGRSPGHTSEPHVRNHRENGARCGQA
jgi:hypothetical protein